MTLPPCKDGVPFSIKKKEQKHFFNQLLLVTYMMATREKTPYNMRGRKKKINAIAVVVVVMWRHLAAEKPPSRRSCEIFVQSFPSAVTVAVRRILSLRSPESGYMHTSLMLVCGWMEENTLPCGAQRDQSESGCSTVSAFALLCRFEKQPNEAEMFKSPTVSLFHILMILESADTTRSSGSWKLSDLMGRL